MDMCGNFIRKGRSVWCRKLTFEICFSPGNVLHLAGQKKTINTYGTILLDIFNIVFLFSLQPFDQLKMGERKVGPCP